MGLLIISSILLAVFLAYLSYQINYYNNDNIFQYYYKLGFFNLIGNIIIFIITGAICGIILTSIVHFFYVDHLKRKHPPKVIEVSEYKNDIISLSIEDASSFNGSFIIASGSISGDTYKKYYYYISDKDSLITLRERNTSSVFFKMDGNSYEEKIVTYNKYVLPKTSNFIKVDSVIYEKKDSKIILHVPKNTIIKDINPNLLPKNG